MIILLIDKDDDDKEDDDEDNDEDEDDDADEDEGKCNILVPNVAPEQDWQLATNFVTTPLFSNLIPQLSSS